MVMKASVGKLQPVGSQCNRLRGAISSRRTLRGREGSFPLCLERGLHAAPA